jgi:hypothetical protein
MTMLPETLPCQGGGRIALHMASFQAVAVPWVDEVEVYYLLAEMMVLELNSFQYRALTHI